MSSNQSSRESLFLYLSMFVMGGSGLAYEYTLSKLSTDLLGNSTRSWAITIGLMMFFMGMGSHAQKYVKRNLLATFISIELLIGLVGSFAPILTLFVFGAFRDYFILTHYLCIGLLGGLIGLEIPILTRINTKYTQVLSVNLGGVLQMDYIGALAGALVWVFVLPRFFTLTEGAFVLGFTTVAVGSLTILIFRQSLHYHYRYIAVVVLASLALFYGFREVSGWTIAAEQQLYRHRVVHSQTTKYQHIVMTVSPSKTFSLYINGNLQFSSFDEHVYHENLVHPAMNIALRRNNILILGGGDGLAAREILKYKDAEQVTLVDLDPEMTQLARTHPLLVQLNQKSLSHARLVNIENHPRVIGEEVLTHPNQNSRYDVDRSQIATVKVMNIDAIQFLDQISGRYDVIVIDFPDPNSIELAKLYSQHFYQLLKRKLSPGGIFVQQSTSPVFAKEAFLSIGRTMQKAGLAVVPYHHQVPSFGEWGWWLGGDTKFYSAAGIEKRLREIPALMVATKYLTSQLISHSLAFGRGQLDSKKKDVTTLTNSKVFEYYVQGWEHFF